MQYCPCGTGKVYTDCCGLYISGSQLPSIPEALMRSRYTAYTRADMTYIEDTMKPPALNYFDAKAAYQWASSVKWIKLEVIKSSVNKAQGFVEFIAYYEEQGTQKVIYENSEFRQEQGKWYYVRGESDIGRNEVCPCGSGKKYKKCCLRSIPA